MESRLEPALLYLRGDGRLQGILATHVDDVMGGLLPELVKNGVGLEKSSKALGFAANRFKDFMFRGRESGSWQRHSLLPSWKCSKVGQENLVKQFRCDLAYENAWGHAEVQA